MLRALHGRPKADHWCCYPSGAREGVPRSVLLMSMHDERERKRRRAGYDDGRAGRSSLLLSNKAKKEKRKKKKLRALELWRARDHGLRLLGTSSILSAHVLKICCSIRARAWSFCKFPKPFLCLRRKKSI